MEKREKSGRKSKIGFFTSQMTFGYRKTLVNSVLRSKNKAKTEKLCDLVCSTYFQIVSWILLLTWNSAELRKEKLFHENLLNLNFSVSVWFFLAVKSCFSSVSGTQKSRHCVKTLILIIARFFSVFPYCATFQENHSVHNRQIKKIPRKRIWKT